MVIDLDTQSVLEINMDTQSVSEGVHKLVYIKLDHIRTMTIYIPPEINEDRVKVTV